MKHLEAFSALYAMSSCCMMNDPQRLLPRASANQPPSGALANALSAQAAASAPDTMNLVDQYVPDLKRYRAIAIDVGTKDPFLTTNTQLDQALTRLGVTHNFESYDGDHGSRITARFAARVLPFFSANLAGGSTK